MHFRRVKQLMGVRVNRLEQSCLAMVAAIAVLYATGGCGSGSRGPSSEPAETLLPASGVVMPFEYGGGDVLLKVKTPSGECWMLIDTGANCVMVSPRLAKKEKLRVVATDAPMMDMGGNIVRGHVVQLDVLELGEARFMKVNALERDLTKWSKSLGREIDLVGGLPLFRKVLLTVDYPAQKIVLERGDLPEPGGQVLPLQRAAGDRWLMPVSVASREIWARPDTAAECGLACPDWAAALFPESKSAKYAGRVRYWGGEGINSIAKIRGQMRFGEITVQDPVISLAGKMDPLVGHELLSQFRVTLDQRNARIRLQQAKPGPVELTGPLIPGFAVDRMSSRVTGVLSGSGAELAGLRAGDAVLAINGIAFTPEPQSYRLPRSKREKLTVTIDRNGERKDIVMTMTPVLR